MKLSLSQVLLLPSAIWDVFLSLLTRRKLCAKNQAALGVRTAAVQRDQQKAFLKYFPREPQPCEKEGCFSCFVHA